MKLIELQGKINTALEEIIKGERFNSSDELNQLICEKINTVETELGNLIRINHFDIRLIEEDEINVFGSVGEVLFHIKKDFKLDKRVKYGFKGVLNKVFIEVDKKITDDLLNMELIELPIYFNKKEKENNIKWLEEKILSLQNEIAKYEIELNKLRNEVEK